MHQQELRQNIDFKIKRKIIPEKQTKNNIHACNSGYRNSKKNREG
jgi:hypothetical protein